MKRSAIAQGFLVGAAVLAAAGAARAQAVLFDPDGPYGVASPMEVEAFDFVPGNVLAKNAVPAAASGVGATFDNYSHAVLGALTRNNVPLSVPGLNTAYELSYVLRYGETITEQVDLNGNGFKEYAQFQFNPAAPTFFELWFSLVPPNASNLAGTGFNDSIRVLRGRVVRGFSNFLVVEQTVPALGGTPVPLDQFNVNNYPAVTTVAGAGSGHPLTIEVLEWDERWFPAIKAAETLSFNIQVLNASIGLPFVSIDPSPKFVGEAGGTAPLVSAAVGPVNGFSGPDVLFQADTNAVIQTIPRSDQTCRMTGGGVTVTGDIIYNPDGSPLATASGSSAVVKGKNVYYNRYTFGGQIGAPTASQPQPRGEWTHHQFQGPDGDFVFHAGTASAPPETKVLKVGCYDPGFCQPARPAPFKQLNWEGIGQFKTAKGIPSSWGVQVGKSLHYVKVHYEDLGEPGGPNGAQTKNANCPARTIGSVVGDPKTDPTAAQICYNCPDVYQITIYKKATDPAVDKSNSIIYAVGGYIDHGNIQLHPAIK